MTAKSISQLLKWSHDDYAEAAADILAYIGDISQEEIFGRNVLCATYIRPPYSSIKNEDGTIKKNDDGTDMRTYHTVAAMEEDIPQGKVLLILKCGPEAFTGDESFRRAMFADREPPKAGQWLFASPQSGTMMMIRGSGSKRVNFKDRTGREHPKYDWDGWPCRILTDEQFFGRMSAPNVIV